MARIPLFREIRRRHVYRVAAAYAIVGWLLIQIAATTFPLLLLPGWAARTVVILVLAGFPIALVLAWTFDAPAIASSNVGDGASRHRSWRMGIGIGVAGVLIALIAGGAWWHSERAGVSTRSPRGTIAATAGNGKPIDSAVVSGIDPKSVAVLPFENLSADPNNAYFTDGVQDLILTKLADIGDLKVISRTSTAKFRSHPADLKTIARELRVGTVLEGSVQKTGNEVLINVQLIDARADNHLWAHAYTRTLDNIFGVEGEVAQEVADALKAKLSGAEQHNVAVIPTRNRAAYDLFLRAEYLANKSGISFDTVLMKQAIVLYQQAVAADPGFAVAWARLSWMQSLQAWFGGAGTPVPSLVSAARANAERALALQPVSADALLAMGYSDYYGRSDYPSALRAFASALQARPNDADAMMATAFVLRRQGRFEPAIAQLQAALQRDPRNSRSAFELALTQLMVRRYADAEDGYERALALDPDNLQAKVEYSQAILYGSGDVARALSQVQGDDPILKTQRVSLLTLQRKYGDAIRLLDGIPDTPDNFTHLNGPKAMIMAGLYRLAGDEARARALFQRALPLMRVDLVAQAGNDINLSSVWSNLATIELGLGNDRAAMDAISKSEKLVARSADRMAGPQTTLINAQLYAEAHRPDQATAALQRVLTASGAGWIYSPVMLRIDPAWDPIRNDLHFRTLLQKYAAATPATPGSAGT